MILKTYTRIFTTDLEKTMQVLRGLHTGEPHLRFRFDPWDLVGIGDMLVIAGTEEALAPIRGSFGPWVVSDIDDTRRLLIEAGAEVTQEIALVPTGRMMYVRHPDGALVEYVQWNPELVEQIIDGPRRAGKLASEV